ncbi:MAG TPA: TolC family protein [Candidatus Coprenecus stercoravium]|uniref:TolC family protein n=1 Tax=Candidatus Coprenecus stercoravium TaxID=2840735 RepID=A0A9D2GQN8_9BACT|nr:TolC family protein [Candidatus Coprenecus stercoravium]
MRHTIRHISTVLALAAAIVLLQGCGAAVRKCVDPQIEIPQTIIPGEEADSLCLADLEWAEIFSDPLLKDLIGKTLEHNRDMLTASARVRELERLHRVARAEQFPSFRARANMEQENYQYTDADPVKDNEFGLKAAVSWEIDIFGRLRWANRAAMAEYLSSIESQRAMQMTLVAAVATAYFELTALDNELDIVLRTLDTRRESVRQAKLRFDGGLTTEIPYQQAQVEYASTASLVPDLQRDIALKEHEISLLAGEFPSTVERSLLNTHDQFPDLMHVGVPSDLLQRRPDLMAAKQDLKAAMSEVGVAWAERFPRLEISLAAGVENNTFTHFFTGPFWYPIMSLTSPLFAFGKNRANYQASIEAYNQERYQYEQKILEVFKEVNDAVTSYRSAREKVTLMGNLKDASRKYVELALFQYQNGYISYIDVLDAQRSYFNSEIDYSNSVRDEFLAIIDLYKALGGGWSVPSDEDAEASADTAKTASKKTGK